MGSHLTDLEDRSIFVIREARARLENIAMLWSIGKDSTVLLWLARKAFLGAVPFPLIHVDTTKKIPEMIAFRDKIAREWNLDLIVSTNRAALADGMGPHLGRVTCCNALKRDPLKAIVQERGFQGIFLGIRRDEDGTRSKERYFSPRDRNFEWTVRDQPPELWDHFTTQKEEGTHFRIHPLLHWTELDVWEYIAREKIPVTDLYFAKEGRRYRSLGCAPCTGSIESNARNAEEVVAELRATRVPERAGRAQDQETEDAFERLRAAGYM
jgi:sulfate adenylyltransferase subunit 2